MLPAGTIPEPERRPAGSEPLEPVLQPVKRRERLKVSGSLKLKWNKCPVCLAWYVTIFNWRLKHCRCGSE